MATVSVIPPEISASFGGQLLQPSDPAYEQARRVHNGLVDKRPAIIAGCRGTADIVDAVKLAQALGLEISVRGGGHNVGGRAATEGGLMIDLAPMQGIHVDPSARTARAQGGALWKGFNRETQLHGLATTGGVVSSTGLAGLTLGGGLGWLMPKYGLALDNLRSAEMVLADGRVVRASADENADLFWAIRGGGGNFGVAASLEYKLHPVGPMITGGVVAHPFSVARDVLRFFRDTCRDLPDELMLVAGLLTGPDGSRLAGIVGSHCGDLAAGEAALRPIKAFGTPALDAMGPIPYSALNSLMDPSFPKGALNYWKSQLLSDMTDDSIDVLLERFAASPTPMTQIVIEHFHGAATRVPVADTACTLRVPGFNVVIAAQWMDPAETDRCIQWARETYRALTPYFGGTRYVNYLDQDETDDPAAMAYGANYARLRDIKRLYDPDNLFQLNVNIRPSR